MIIGIDASHANRTLQTGTERYAMTLIRTLATIDARTPYRLYSDTALRTELHTLGSNFEERVLGWPPRRLWTQGRLSLEMALRPPSLLFVPAHVLPLIHPQRTVTTIHDVGFLRLPERYSRKELLYNRFALSFAVRAATRIIVPSAFTRDELTYFYPSIAGKVDVIPHGFDASAFQPAEADDVRIVTAHYRIDRPYFLFVGRIQQKKNVDRLLRAFQAFRVARPDDTTVLVLAGQIDHGFSEMRAFMHDQGLDDHVVVTGYAPASHVKALLTGARAFVFPSLYEGFGFPILEAQCVGIPVMTSSAACLPEVAGGGALIVDPLSVGSIADGMIRIVSDDELRRRLRERGTANIKRFSWRRAAEQTRDVLLAAAS